MMMFVYGIEAQAAFDVLRTHSQEHNVKLGLIVEHVVKDPIELSTVPPASARRGSISTRRGLRCRAARPGRQISSARAAVRQPMFVAATGGTRGSHRPSD